MQPHHLRPRGGAGDNTQAAAQAPSVQQRRPGPPPIGRWPGQPLDGAPPQPAAAAPGGHRLAPSLQSPQNDAGGSLQASSQQQRARPQPLQQWPARPQSGAAPQAAGSRAFAADLPVPPPAQPPTRRPQSNAASSLRAASGQHLPLPQWPGPPQAAAEVAPSAAERCAACYPVSQRAQSCSTVPGSAG